MINPAKKQASWGECFPRPLISGLNSSRPSSSNTLKKDSLTVLPPMPSDIDLVALHLQAYLVILVVLCDVYLD